MPYLLSGPAVNYGTNSLGTFDLFLQQSSSSSFDMVNAMRRETNIKPPFLIRSTKFTLVVVVRLILVKS